MEEPFGVVRAIWSKFLAFVIGAWGLANCLKGDYDACSD